MQKIIFCLVILWSATSAKADAVIGIFGDLHGDKAIATAVLKKMKRLGVTEVIGTGDFVAWGGPDSLNGILSQITPLTGVPKNKIYLLPGNWEHESNYPPKVMNDIMKNYGKLVFENYDGYGFVEIGDDRIMVSHFPQHTVPDEFLPPKAFRRQIGNQAYVMDTIERGIFPPKDVLFEIFAHTHVGGYFKDPQTGKIVVNPGVLDMRTKAPTEPRAFMVFDQKSQTFYFYNADTGEEIRSFQLKDGSAKSSPCMVLLRE